NEMLVGDLAAVWPPGAAWVVSTVVAGAAALLVFRLVAMRLDSRALRLLALVAGVQLVSLRLSSGFLFHPPAPLAFPTLLALLAGGAGKQASVRLPAFVTLACALFVYSVAFTHDWNAISRTATRAATDLRSAGIDERFIDAGVAQTGFEMYDRSHE